MASISEKIDFLEGQIASVRGWIATHGPGTPKAWPDHDCEVKRQKLEMLKEIRNDYATAQQRKAS